MCREAMVVVLCGGEGSVGARGGWWRDRSWSWTLRLEMFGSLREKSGSCEGVDVGAELGVVLTMVSFEEPKVRKLWSCPGPIVLGQAGRCPIRRSCQTVRVGDWEPPRVRALYCTPFQHPWNGRKHQEPEAPTTLSPFPEPQFVLRLIF